MKSALSEWMLIAVTVIVVVAIVWVGAVNTVEERSKSLDTTVETQLKDVPVPSMSP